MVTEGSAPPCGGKPWYPGPKTGHLGALGFLLQGAGEAEAGHPSLCQVAETPGEAWGMPAQDPLGPEGHSSLLGLGGARVLR